MISSRILGQMAPLGRRQVVKAMSTAAVTKIEEASDREKPMSKAMKAYLERAREQEAFMTKERQAFQIGRRHLANMMGLEESTMTQEDIDEAIKYLFPSGLFQPKAKPFMKDPDVVFPKKKSAEFDETGRPFHTFFYTRFPNFYEVMATVATKLQECDKHQDIAFRRRDPRQVLQLIPESEKIKTKGTEWLDRISLEKRLLEPIDEIKYNQFVAAMDRLLEHPFAHKCKAFIEDLRKQSFVDALTQEIAQVEFTEDGKQFCRGEAKRKWAYAWVKVFMNGSGKFEVNGLSYLPDFFQGVQEREVVSFPLILTGLLGKVDVECEVIGGERIPIEGDIFLPLPRREDIRLDRGYSARAGAVRLAISRALTGLVDEETRKQMRIAGLLTEDVRYRERKWPGQEKARKKWAWKKR